MYPKARIDALTDGIFAVAMTLLVLDIRLPEEFHPRDGGELLRAFASLWPLFIPYVISFLVLGLRWLWNVEIGRGVETVDLRWARWWLLYMLLITCVPFTTFVLGRYSGLAPAIWIYSANTLLIGLAGMQLVPAQGSLAPGMPKHRRFSPLLLVVTSALAVIVSLVSPSLAIWVFFLTPLAPAIERILRRGANMSPA
jgi:uncharacterized membrane protein